MADQLSGNSRSSLDKVNYETFTFKFPPQDPRIAGVLTTSRFLGRYVNTALNKNRRRAAALFRIFLCDPMVASIPSRSKDSDEADMDLIYPKLAKVNHAEDQTEEQLRRELKPQDPHGAQADCRACHEKLDPVGRVFAFSALGVSPRASSGALSYRSKSGSRVNIPVAGVGELAQKFTEQQDYQSCQVKHFWRWYVGEDVPMPARREDELIAAFNKLDRKPKDFIAYLIQTPEFKQKPKVLTEPQMLARRATRIMKNCNSCHTQSDVYQMAGWDLTELPYGPNPTARANSIQQLKEILDIENNGKFKEMPPKNSAWKLNDDDFAILKKWLESGAPDYQGVPQVEVP